MHSLEQLSLESESRVPTSPDVPQSLSDSSCWLRRLPVVRREVVFVRHLRDMDDSNPKSRVCMVSTFSRV